LNDGHLQNDYDLWGIIFNEPMLETPADRSLASECAGQYLLTRPQEFVDLLDVPLAPNPL
jgi:hypothetical protein